jgi:hypothetical protein
VSERDPRPRRGGLPQSTTHRRTWIVDPDLASSSGQMDSSRGRRTRTGGRAPTSMQDLCIRSIDAPSNNAAKNRPAASGEPPSRRGGAREVPRLRVGGATGS